MRRLREGGRGTGFRSHETMVPDVNCFNSVLKLAVQ